MEQSKGTVFLQDAARLLENDDRIEYVGFAEGNDLFGTRFDLIITDGMNGNIALKTTEGAARFILESARKALFQDLRSRVGLWMLKPSLDRFREKMDPSRYNGAPMLGLQGLVVKSHGSANRDAFKHSIALAAKLARSGVVDRIGESLSTH
jgi:glycerol-3-phosphate acyltransferase PlsX